MGPSPLDWRGVSKEDTLAKVVLPLFYLLPCFILPWACTQEKPRPKASLNPQAMTTAEELEVDSHGLSKMRVVIKTDRGHITYKFYPRKAPRTVTRIMQLVKEGFYNGISFHRAIPNFVIQAGDPTGTGTGGSGKKLKAEFNDIQHIRGTVAMARSSGSDSADSQFYIALSALSHLDRKFTVFGQVVDGLDVLGKIQRGDKMTSVTLSYE